MLQSSMLADTLHSTHPLTVYQIAARGMASRPEDLSTVAGSTACRQPVKPNYTAVI